MSNKLVKSPRTRRWGKQKGASVIEYALLAACIIAVCAGLLSKMGGTVSTKLVKSEEQVAGNGVK